METAHKLKNPTWLGYATAASAIGKAREALASSGPDPIAEAVAAEWDKKLDSIDAKAVAEQGSKPQVRFSAATTQGIGDQ